LKKTIKIDRKIKSDARYALTEIITKLQKSKYKSRRDWIDRCIAWKIKYPVCLPEYKNTIGAINVYSFMERLSALAGEGDVFIGDAGSAIYAVSQGVNLLHDNQN
jgi:acetolactate synthase-1/2/3 large subunit